MAVRDKIPDKVLVNVNSLRAVISDHQNKSNIKAEFENSRNIFLALLGALVSCLLTLIPSWNTWDIWLKGLILILTLIFLGLTFWFLIKMLHAWKELLPVQPQDLETHIIDRATSETLYTALLIICYQETKSGEVKFMTEKKGNFLIHCPMDPEKRVSEQNEDIINYLATSYNVQKKHVVDITPLSEYPFFSIKPVHGETKQNGFVFFQIKLKKGVLGQLHNHPDIEEKSIQEMEGLPDLMGRNQDIVMALVENKTKIVDSFGDASGPLHIIWNITNECPYHCEICATYDESRVELSTDDKLRVLTNIFSAKENISMLDFAGGDPMYKSDVRTLIMQAINSLGEDHISITTTGRGIQAADGTPEEEISKLLKKCEITIDASHENLGKIPAESPFSRNSPEYCSYNYEQIQNTSENLQDLVINIPLVDDDLDDSEIDTLISRLLKLKKDYSEIHVEAQIIRLMPVGAFNSKCKSIDDYKKYQPLEIAQKITDRIEGIGIPCRYHCSLRILPGLGVCEKRCHMLDQKIGIDCAGNVFACTWGAYLQLPNNYNITQNPFYLGNLVSNSLKDILTGQGIKTTAYKRISRDIHNQTPKPYCEVVSWFFQKALGGNNDPLSKK